MRIDKNSPTTPPTEHKPERPPSGEASERRAPQSLDADGFDGRAAVSRGACSSTARAPLCAELAVLPAPTPAWALRARPARRTSGAGHASNRTAPLSDGLRGLLRAVRTEVERRYGRAPEAFAAGAARANLIGEHVDNFGGRTRTCSIPYAIDRQIAVAAHPTPDRIVELTSMNAGTSVRFDLDALARPDFSLHLESWARFPQAVLKKLLEEYPMMSGFRGVLSGNIEGKGTSSSAALSVALTLIASELFQLDLSGETVVEVARAAENATGVACGYMDQMASVFGEKDRAVAVHFRGSERPEVEPVRFDLGDHVLIAIDSGVERDLRTSNYNQRVAECRTALALFTEVFARRGRTPPEALADISEADLRELGSIEALEAHVTALPEGHPHRALTQDDLRRIRRRVVHVVDEIVRTEAVRALLASAASDRVARIGALLTECHASLRDHFEVSIPELDTLVNSALSHGALGARLMGAGEGGNMVLLVEKAKAEAVLEGVRQDYERAHGRTVSGFVCMPSAGSRGIPREVGLSA